MGIYRPQYQPDVTNTPKEAAVLQDFAHLLEASGSVVHILDEIERVKFRKNFWCVVRNS
jgi:2-dehydropantoate 2-reductase